MRKITVASACVLLSIALRPAVAQGAEAGLAFAVGVGAVAIVSAAVDIAGAPGSARLTNAEHGLTLAPTFDPVDRSVGVALSVPFGAGRGRRVQARRSPGVALGRSLFATLIPAAVGTAGIAVSGGNDNVAGSIAGASLIVGAVVVGPAAGHWYAGQPRRAARGIRLRALTLAASGLLTFAVLVTSLED
jgi:hypothetical protein